MNTFINYQNYLSNIDRIKNLTNFNFEDFKSVPLEIIEIIFKTKDIDFYNYDNFLYFKNIYIEKNKHWEDINNRWYYYNKVIDILKNEDVRPEKILEAGPFGAPIVDNCHTIDYKGFWFYKDMCPTYEHDLRHTPWPISDKQYDWFIALRVFQHLNPVQKECVHESLRISNNLIFIIPEKIITKDVSRLPIKKEDLISWVGIEPTFFKKLPKLGNLYVWKRD